MPSYTEDVEIQDGILAVKDRSGTTTVSADGDNAHIRLGGGGKNGDVSVRAGDDVETILLSGRHGNLTLGGQGHDGDIFIRDSSGTTIIHADGDNAHMRLGGGGKNGDVSVRAGDDVETILLSGRHGNLTLGGQGHDGDIFIRDSSGVTTISLDGDSGDIRLMNADFAEEFDVDEQSMISPGTVVVVNQKGKLKQSEKAYDKKVLGVISGAGGYRAGIVLDSRESSTERLPVALVGKVCCRVDADYAAVEVGDLLTTSPTPGHAMKASDPTKAFGAVIGKALGSLASGRAMITIAVALQ